METLEVDQGTPGGGSSLGPSSPTVSSEVGHSDTSDTVTSEAPDTPAPAPENTPDTVAVELQKARRDAAKYRSDLRSAQAEAEAVRGQLEAFQRSEVARLLGSGHLSDGIHQAITTQLSPELFWAGGAQLADLVNADGTVDVRAVHAAVVAVADRFGLTLEQAGPRSPGLGSGQVDMGRSSNWASSFTPTV